MGAICYRALIRAPLPQVWEFLTKPENMHLWGPPTRPVTGFDRPFQEGDRVTIDRRDYFWSHRQVLLLEKVVPNHSLHFRDLSPGTDRFNVTATFSVEAAKDGVSSWVEEEIFYSFGSGRVMQWLDRGVITPIFYLGAAPKAGQVFRRLRAYLEKPRVGSTSENTQQEGKGVQP